MIECDKLLSIFQFIPKVRSSSLLIVHTVYMYNNRECDLILILFEKSKNSNELKEIFDNLLRSGLSAVILCVHWLEVSY